MNQEKIGKFIAELRKQKKLTQEQLAEKLGITKNAVSKWERGLGLMDLSLLKPLSEILGVSVTEILNGEKIDEEIDLKSEEILIILLTIIITIFSIILLDTIQAVAFKNSPIISWRVEDVNDSDSYVDKGFLIDTYYCVKEQDIVTVIPTFKNTNYNCPSE